MHFSKFMTVSQIRQNTKLISEQLKKSAIQQHQYTITEREGQVNHYQIRIKNKPTLSPSLNQHLASLSPLPHHQRLQHRYVNPEIKVNSISPIYKQNSSNSPFLRVARRKYSQNNLQFKLKPTPSTHHKHAQQYNTLKIPKAHHKTRNSSCQLEGPTLINNSHKNARWNDTDLASHNQGREFSNVSTWNEANSYKLQVESSNNHDYSPHLTKSQACTTNKQTNRKHSDNVNTKKIPSFLTASKQYRKSFDSSNQVQEKLTINSFVIVRQLGKGAFGRVVLAMDKRTGMFCAIKIMDKRQIVKDNMVQQLIRQLKIQMYLSHPNIIKVYGFFDDLLHLYIVIECALDGQLSDYLQRKTNPLTEAETSLWFYQTCNAVSVMHSSSIIHRDLKPENLMIHEGIIKICDFGWSVIRGSQLRSTFCGTPLYLCPQVLVGDEYDESVDIWALGVILYEMLCKENPFRITCQQELIKIINSPVQFTQCTQLSQQVKEVIAMCLSKKATERPNIRELLLHSFLLEGQLRQQAKR